jgi:hypothetical protein
MPLTSFLLLHENSDQRNAAKQAWKLIQKMEDLNLDRYTEVKPNSDCYKHVLKAISNAKPRYLPPDAGDIVHRILTTMENDGLVMDSQCFSYAINTWCKKARQNQSTPDQRFEDAIEAQLLLGRMDEMYHRTRTVDVRPTTFEYTNVMEAFAKSNHDDALPKAEMLLSIMERQHKDGNVSVLPSSYHYRTIMAAWQNHHDFVLKVNGAKRIFEHMIQQYKNGNHACKPTIDDYNAMIRVCRTVHGTANSEEKTNTLKCVTDLVTQIRYLDDIQMNSATYNLLLHVFGNLLEKGTREQAIETLFSKCCAEGFVDKRVLLTIKRFAPNELYHRNGLGLPKEWSRNVIGDESIISGNIERNINKMNFAYQERKMRNLRQRKRQSILQGGRMV